MPDEPDQEYDLSWFACQTCGGEQRIVVPDHGPECYAAGDCVGGAQCPVPIEVDCPDCVGKIRR
jgi:hypothetical protein